jgi:hypothetical protein
MKADQDDQGQSQQGTRCGLWIWCADQGPHEHQRVYAGQTLTWVANWKNGKSGTRRACIKNQWPTKRPFHRSREVGAFLNLFEDRIQVYSLPPYCPELNLIERFWKHLKDYIIYNKLFPSIGLLLDNLERFRQQPNDLNFLKRFRFAKNFQWGTFVCIFLIFYELKK